MALRGFEIESQIEDLDDFVANLSAQRNAANVDEETFEAIVENCKALRTRNLREVEDLSKTSKALRSSGKAKVEEEPASTQSRARAKSPQLIAEMP
jgi:wobble nucleotide-excising tRNase